MITAIKRSAGPVLSKTIPLTINLYVLSWLVTLLLLQLFWSAVLPPVGLGVVGIYFFLPLGILVITVAASKKAPDPFQILKYFFGILAFAVSLNLIFFHYQFQNYGDNGQLSELIQRKFGFERWMLGSTVLNDLYNHLWHGLALRLKMPDISNADFFVRFFGALMMIFSSVFFLWKYPGKLAVLLPLITPTWLLFTSGYNEYYPFIAPFLLAGILFLAGDKLEMLTPFWIGLVSAALALLYPGFIPLSALILLSYILKAGVRKGVTAGVFAVGCALMLVVLLWNGSLGNFIHGYILKLNLGETNTLFNPYKGKALADTPFFSPVFLFTAGHLRDFFFMLSWGGGLVALPLAVYGVWHGLKNRLVVPVRLLRDSKVIALFGFFLWQLIYIFIKIPRLGPVRDVDLFFSANITFAFLAGYVFDRIRDGRPAGDEHRLDYSLFAVVLGHTAAILIYLLVAGINI